MAVANMWRDNPRPAAAAAAILRQRADLVLLQEVKGAGSALRVIKAHYPFHATCPKACTLHILSRFRLDQDDPGIRPLMPWRNRNTVLDAMLTLPGGRRIRVVTVHIPRPFANQNGETVRAALARALHAVPPTQTLLAGDFNAAFLTTVLARQDGLFAPLVRQTRMATYPARVGIGSLGISWPFPLIAIDHLYMPADWQTVRLRRLAIPGSDHFGLVATLTPSP